MSKWPWTSPTAPIQCHQQAAGGNKSGGYNNQHVVAQHSSLTSCFPRSSSFSLCTSRTALKERELLLVVVLGQDMGTTMKEATQLKRLWDKNQNQWVSQEIQLLKTLMKFFLGNKSMKLKRWYINKFAHELLSRQGHVTCKEVGHEP